MFQTFQEVFERAVERLSAQIVTYIPPLLAGLAIVAVTILLARIARLLLSRVFKGIGVDRFLQESGLASLLPGTGPIRVAPIISQAIYWLILILGILTAVNVFDTKLTSQIVETTVYLFPKLVGAAAILMTGFWLAQFLGRSVLIWASNEELPHPRRIASGVRVAVVFVATVVCSDILDFAERVFFAAFVIFSSGAVLTCSLAFGLGARGAVSRWLEEKERRAEDERPMLKHL